VLLATYWKNDQINEDEMGREYSMNEIKEKQDLGIDGIILK
jgi:hypothetical protein